MTRGLALAGAVALAACGSDAPPIPATIAAGPVAIDTATATLTFGGRALAGFVAVGVVDAVDPAHYYDARAPGTEATLVPATHATSVRADGAVVFDGGIAIAVAPCDATPDCATITVDASANPRAAFVQLALPRAAGEPIFGGGDTPSAPDLAGTIRELQLRVDPASASSTNETHVPVPLVLSPRTGTGAFAADDRPGAIDATADDRVALTFALPARGAYRVHLFAPPEAATDPLALVRRYVALTARPAVPPRWAFAPQQWRNAWASSDEVRGDADAMRARHIPGSTMWIDNPWQTAYNDFTIDPARFVAAAQLMADLRARGYRVVFWSTPYVGTGAATAADHQDGAAHHYFVTTDTGAVLDYPWQDGPGALVDFTADGATAWWRARIARVIALGASGFKLDFGEDVVTDLSGSVVAMELAAGDNGVMHRRYAAGYHDAYLGALPSGDGFVITRAGAWGEQATNTAVWPGDLDSDFGVHGGGAVGGLPTAISRGLGLSLSGYPFYGSDIGGFRGFPTSEALVRWAEYAAYGTIMQLGGGGASHDPWDQTLFAPGTDAIYATYAREHMALVPYLWTLAQRAGRDGTPVTRAAKFAYACACDDAMFALGDDLVVAPVIVAGATTRTAVLPPGTWRDPATGAYTTADGAMAITVPAPLATIPTWTRAGSLIPTYARAADTLEPATAAGVTSYADPAFGAELLLRYTPRAAASVDVHDGTHATADGATTFAVAAGTDYAAITLAWDPRGETGALAAPTSATLDGAALPAVAIDALATCAAPGCFAVDTARVAIRVVLGDHATHAVVAR